MNTRHVKYLVIGGGIAGVSGAEAIRSQDATGAIAISAAEPHLPYSRVLLPAYLKGKIPRERLFLGSLAVAVLAFGLWPAPLFDVMHPSIQNLYEHMMHSKVLP